MGCKLDLYLEIKRLLPSPVPVIQRGGGDKQLNSIEFLYFNLIGIFYYFVQTISRPTTKLLICGGNVSFCVITKHLSVKKSE